MSNLITNNIDTQIKDKIYTIRGLQVMLDIDLANIYSVEVKRLNEQVKRNIERFPGKFRFQLTQVLVPWIQSISAQLKSRSSSADRCPPPTTC
jgi:hypothetical protein